MRQACSHGCLAVVDLAQKALVPITVEQGTGEFQVSLSGGVQDHVFALVKHLEALNVGGPVLLSFVDVTQGGSGRSGSQGFFTQAETVQGKGFKMVQELFGGSIKTKTPRLQF